MDNGNIDFELEGRRLTHLIGDCVRGMGHLKCGDPNIHVEEWGRSIAQRVEESTIKRCYAVGKNDPARIEIHCERLYTPESKANNRGVNG